MLKEYKSVQEIVGPLMIVEGVEGIKYEELVEIQTQTGEVLLFLVLIYIP